MSFQSPWFLAALLLVPLAVYAYVEAQRRRRSDVLRFTGVAPLASVLPKGPGIRRHVPPALYLVAIAALAVALARPEVTVSVPREEATVMLVTDVSGSMEADDVAPTRLAAARSAANRFLDEVPDEVRVGLVAFSSTASVLQFPTTERDPLRIGLATLSPQGGTATGEAIRTALRALAQDPAALDPGGEQGTPGAPAPDPGQRPPAAMILLSDGKATSGADPVGAAEQARQLGVPIYTVALGTPDGQLLQLDRFGIPQVVSVPPDPESLRQIAQASGGEFFDAIDAAQLSTVYERLGSQLGSEEEERDITAAFAGGGLAFLLIAGAFSLLWVGRLP